MQSGEFPVQLVAYLKSLSYGGLLGAGILGIAFLLQPHLFPGAVSLTQTLWVGGVLGTGLHRLVGATISETLLSPIGRFVTYYSELVQLVLLRNLIGQERQRELVGKLTETYFLGDAPRKQLLR